MSRTRISIDPNQYVALVNASEVTGRSFRSLVDEALEQFIECNAVALIETAAERSGEA